MRQGRVRVGPLMSIPAVLRELGREPGPIFDSAGLTMAQFADADTQVSYVGASRLLACCVATTRCQHFGLLVGQRAAPSSLGLAGFLLQNAPDVGTALHALVRHLDLHEDGGLPTLVTEDNFTRLGYTVYQAGTEATDQVYDVAIAIASNIMRSLCGEDWKPTEVLLSRRSPLDLAPYRSFFRAPIHFNANESALLFPNSWLEHRIPNADPLLYEYLEKEAAELHTLQSAGSVDALRGLLRRVLLAGHCTAGDIARRLCIHERTLNRKLREAGTTFRQELEAVRYELAQQLLADSSMPIARIATTLDYADVSAFSRAFKRWSGIAPARWRAQQRP